MTDWLFFPHDEETLPASVEDWTFGAIAVETWGVSQATGGYGRASDGRWVVFPPNAPRTYFDPVTLEDRGLLIEPESYQTVFKPRSTPLGLTLITRTEFPDEVGPLGVGVFKIAASASTGNHIFNLLSGGTVAEHILDNTTVTGQWLIKPDGLNRFSMFCQKRDGIYAVAEFDMRGDGVVSGLIGCTATIERDVLGYYRMGMTVNSSVGLSTFRFGGQMALDSGSRNFLGDGVSGFRVAYFGIERGDSLTSPSTANGTTATIRAADSVISSVPWIGTGPKSFGLEFTPLTSLDQTVFEAGTADRMQLRIEGGNLRYVASTAGESVAFLSGPTLASGKPRSVIVTAGFNEFLLGHAGTLLGVDKVGSAPSNISSMRLGANLDGVNCRPIAVKRLRFWNQALSEAATLQFSKDLTTEGQEQSETKITVQPTLTVPADQNTVTFLVTLSQQDLAASVNYRTVNGTAVSGVNFIEATGTLTFSSGEMSREVTVQLGARPDSDKSFVFELNFPINATIDNAVCQITLLGSPRILPVTSLEVSFGPVMSANWTLTRPSPVPRRKQDGIWELVAPNAPAHSWINPNYNSGIIVDALGHDQCLFDSVLPKTFLGLTHTIDLAMQTMVGTRSVEVRETAEVSEHRFIHPITGTAPATAEVPTGDFTVWLIVEPVGRTRWILEVKGRDNVWHSYRFNLSGAGTAEIGIGPGAWAAVRQDEFFPTVYRIALGKGQGAFAGVDPEFTLAAADESWNTVTMGSTANALRIIHMQVESRAGWGSPLVTAAATGKAVRAPDDLRPNGTWFKRNNFSLGLVFGVMSSQPPVQRIVHLRDDVPMTDDYGIYISNGVVGAPNTTGAVFNGTMPGSSTIVNGLYTVVLASDPALRFALFQDGVKTGEQLFAGKAPPNLVDAMRIGARLDGASLQACSIFLQAFRYWEGALTDTEGVHYSAFLTGPPPPPPVVPPVVSVPSTLNVKEGQILTVPVSKSGTGACSITYTTKAATAKFGIDYNGVGPVVMNFGANETQKTFTVQTIADTLIDPAEVSGETFTVELSAPVGCTLGNKTSVVTIVSPPVVSLPLTASVKEGDVLSINLVKFGGDGACSVAWETKQAGASVGIDYTGVGSPPVVVNFGEFETSKTLTVSTIQDAISDPNEKFNIILSAESGCSVGQRTCEVTITDDEAAVSGIYKRAKTFASQSDAGIGKTVYRVTNLKDDNVSGSLRFGINQGSRHIIFEVGGVIKLSGDLSFTKTDLTISGETAPYPGITIQGTANSGGSIIMGSSKRVHWSHINFERCHDARVQNNSNGDVVILSPGLDQVSEYIEFRHCSFFWGNDECVSIYPTKGVDPATGKGYPDDRRGRAENISFADCLFAEGLFRPEDLGYRAHYENGAIESNHNYGTIVGMNAKKIDFQYCVWADMSWRCPFIDGKTSVVLANNIAINCGKGAHLSINTTYDYTVQPSLITNVGYLVISGPINTTNSVEGMRLHIGNYIPPAGTVVWVDGLYSMKGPGAKITPGTTTSVSGSTADAKAKQLALVVDITKVGRPVDIPDNPVVKMTANEIHQRAIDNLGPFPKKRIANLQRKTDHIKLQTGAFVNHETQSGVNGPSSLTATARALNGTTTMDGTTIPVYPTISNPATADQKKKVREWLEFFLSRIQYD